LLNKLLQNQKQYTIRYNYTNLAVFLNTEQKQFYKNAFQPREKVKHRVLDSKHFTKEIYEYLTNPEMLYDEKVLKRLLKNFSIKKKTPAYKTNLL
jgi:hypothetical protein